MDNINELDDSKKELTIEEKVERLTAALPLIQDIRKIIENAKGRAADHETK